jgi:hypothetical protein
MDLYIHPNPVLKKSILPTTSINRKSRISIFEKKEVEHYIEVQSDATGCATHVRLRKMLPNQTLKLCFARSSGFYDFHLEFVIDQHGPFKLTGKPVETSIGQEFAQFFIGEQIVLCVENTHIL